MLRSWASRLLIWGERAWEAEMLFGAYTVPGVPRESAGLRHPRNINLHKVLVRLNSAF